MSEQNESLVVDRLEQLALDIELIERSWTHDVRIMAVTKGFSGWAVGAAVAAGCTQIGENYAQELIAKSDVIGRLEPSPDVYFIGQLQSNKVRQLVDIVDVWASIDRSSIIREVAKRSPGAHILIQVNATNEPGKGGCAPEAVAELTERARELGLKVDGLMTVGPTGEPPEAARHGFRLVRGLADELQLSTCSMGMSADVRIAVEEGSTQIRVGTALFGPRPPKI